MASGARRSDNAPSIRPFGVAGHQLVGRYWSDKEHLTIDQDPSNIATFLLTSRFPRLADAPRPGDPRPEHHGTRDHRPDQLGGYLHMKRAIKATAVALGTVAAMLLPILEAAAQSKPNIVFILVDNVGWGDWSVYGGTTATPRIDKLASEGIRFNNYNAEVQCTPSRSAIMTGRHPVRSGTYSVLPPPGGAAGMAPWEYTIAELLSDAGYATALYGKWHLGNIQGR